MTTLFIGLKDFRQNISTYALNAQKKKIRYIVLKKNKPMFEVKPLTAKAFAMEQLHSELEEAREDVRKGKVYTYEQALKKLGLD